MSASRASLLILLMLAGTGAWWAWFCNRSAPVHSPITAPSADRPGDRQHNSDNRAIANPTTRPTTAERIAAGTSHAQRSIPEAAEWISLRVIDRESGAPVPHARVRWSNSASSEASRKVDPSDRARLDLESLAERFGWQSRADENGRARIAGMPKTGAIVHAYAEGRYGTARVGAGTVPTGGWTVEIERDITLRVQVLDSANAPAVGVPVMIRWRAPNGATNSFGSVAPIKTAGSAAIAEFRHVQRWLVGNRYPNLDQARWFATARVPGWNHPGVEFDRAVEAVEPLVLRLPPTGSLRARLLHHGRALTEHLEFSAAAAGERTTRPARARPDPDGWARFPFVALQSQLTVAADAGLGSLHRTVTGPRSDDEEVHCELSTASGFCLTGAVLGPQSHPLDDATVRVQLQSKRLRQSGSLPIDAEGRFLWLLGDDPPSDEAIIEQLVFLTTWNHVPMARLERGPLQLHRGVNDLGLLQLTSPPLLVAGRIMVDGEPDLYSAFRVQALMPGHTGKERWSRIEAQPTRHLDGSFEVRGRVSAARYRLVFRGERHLPIPPIEFRPGTTDLEVSLARGHELTVPVLTKTPDTAGSLRASLEPFQPKLGDRRHRRFAKAWTEPRDQARELHWHALPAGSYRIAIFTSGVRDPLQVVENVTVPQPSPRDPRLDPLDLRDKSREVTVRVTGRPTGIAHADDWIGVLPLPQPADSTWKGFEVRHHGDKILLPPTPTDLLVVSPGCRPQWVTSTTDQLTVELAAWPHCDVTITNLPTLPPGIQLELWPSTTDQGLRSQFRIGYRMGHRSGQLRNLLRPAHRFAAVAGNTTRLTMGIGSQRLSGALRHASSTEQVDLRAWQPATVDPAHSGAAVTLKCSPSEVHAAIAELRAKSAGR